MVKNILTHFLVTSFSHVQFHHWKNDATSIAIETNKLIIELNLFWFILSEFITCNYFNTVQCWPSQAGAPKGSSPARCF